MQCLIIHKQDIYIYIEREITVTNKKNILQHISLFRPSYS